MTLEELLNCDQGISFRCKYINTLLTKTYKIFSWENPNFMKSIFKKKNIMYNFRTSNILTLPK